MAPGAARSGVCDMREDEKFARKWAYIERVKGRRRMTDRWAPIKDIYHEFKRGKNKGKFLVVMANGKAAIATSIQEDFRRV